MVGSDTEGLVLIKSDGVGHDAYSRGGTLFPEHTRKLPYNVSEISLARRYYRSMDFPIPVAGATVGDSVVYASQGKVHGGPGVPQPLKSEDDVVTEFIHD
ncbi:hypothetical protein GEV33_003665 [Tenebrio molitor]|uniref:Uncharacterized protein n=1 Tax=Tenebrio molitor TaxID=7067 RepID=A0A8J6LNE9_TENMO|nr:hypothetical protein GEV33_003665 [Tenebrio molitor]